MDKSISQANESSGWTDTLNVSTDAETAGMSDSDNTGAYLGAGGKRGRADVTDGFRHHVDMLNGHMDMPGISIDMDTPTNATENVRTSEHSKQTRKRET